MFFKKTLLCICLYICLLSSVAFGGLEEVGDATCRIKTGSGGVGTGVIFKETESDLYILTAAHVIINRRGGPELSLRIRLYNSGEMSHEIPAYNVAAHFQPNSTLDIAIIKVEKKDLRDYPIPKPIPIADETYTIKEGDTILSYGCPSGYWPSGWKGKVNIAEKGRTVFKPYAIPGRSGSGIFDKDGTKVIGVLIWKNGTAVPLQLIHIILKAHGI